MTLDEVLAVLKENELPPSALPFVRAEPEDGQEHPGDLLGYFPLQLPDGRFLAVAWMFGQPSDDEVENWKLRWYAVHGPLSFDELKEIAGRERYGT